MPQPTTPVRYARHPTGRRAACAARAIVRRKSDTFVHVGDLVWEANITLPAKFDSESAPRASNGAVPQAVGYCQHVLGTGPLRSGSTTTVSHRPQRWDCGPDINGNVNRYVSYDRRGRRLHRHRRGLLGSGAPARLPSAPLPPLPLPPTSPPLPLPERAAVASTGPPPSDPPPTRPRNACLDSQPTFLTTP